MYVTQGMGTTQIGRLVGKHPKRVYEWLIGYGIEPREKYHGYIPKPKPFHDSDWLRAEYEGGKTFADIGAMCDADEDLVRSWARKFGIRIRTAYESRRLSGRTQAVSGPRHHWFGKTGSLSINWKGGCTPERAACYNSAEWKQSVKDVWNRENGQCQKCKSHRTSSSPDFCIHHIVSFAVKALRTVVSNLVLLCAKCHHWVHSNANVDRLFLVGERQAMSLFQQQAAIGSSPVTPVVATRTRAVDRPIPVQDRQLSLFGE